MAVLGSGGKLLLKRPAPDACLVNAESVIPEINSIQGICDGYWSGDHVSTLCLPLAGDPFPSNPDGYGSYFGSRWFLGPNRTHITTKTDAFYKTDSEDYPDGQFGDDAQFYSREGDVSGGETIDACDNNDYWIHIDELGRVSFYRSRCDALSGCKSKRVGLNALAAGSITIAPYGSLTYSNAVWQCVSEYGEYRFSDGQDTVTLISICADAPKYEIPEAGTDDYDNADLLPRGQEGLAAPFWQVLCDIREWSLELNAAAVETNAVSEKFGTAVKSLVTAGGSTDFLIDRKCYGDTEDNGLMLMQLLLMTEKGCEANAQFWIMTGTDVCNVDCDGRINGGLYYETDILITNTAVNLRPTEIVAGTASFVSTGEIRLLTSP